MATFKWLSYYHPYSMLSMNKNDTSVSIYTSYGLDQSHDKKIPKGKSFAVAVVNEKTGRAVFRYFVTEPQAVRYAKAYMRKN